ncbi:MAG: hypothetical protein NVS3B5_00160 [Sphingomicrobium sp.]
MPIPRRMMFMSSKMKPSVSVDVQARHQPPLAGRRQPNVKGFHQGAAGDVYESIAENIFPQQQFPFARFKRPQIHFRASQSDCPMVNAKDMAHWHEITRLPQRDDQACKQGVILFALLGDHV